MKTNKKTKNMLLASIVTLTLCVTMLIGSTFAWFTDTASTGVNKITAGNLDVKLMYSLDGVTYSNAEDATEIFAGDLWEPGFTKVVYFKIINNGNLAVQYKIGTNVVKNTKGQNKAGEEIDLTKFIKYGIAENITAPFADSAAARASVTATDFVNVSTGEHYLVEKNDEAVFAMVAWMPENTDDKANHNGVKAPSIEFGVNVVATQYTSERDSFGTSYDANATYPSEPKYENIVAAPGTKEELHSILETALTGGSASGTITINLEQDFDVENNWTTVDNSNYSGVNKVVINGNGHFIKNLNQPLLSKLFAGSEGSITFNNLTIKDSVITATGADDEGIGVFVNTTDATNSVTFNECKLENVKITNNGAESYLAGFIGYSSSETLKFVDCAVVNCEFTGMKDVGAFVGYTTAAMTVTKPTVTDTKITSSNTSTYRVGLIAGTVNVNSATITTVTESGNTISQTQASTAKIHDYVGRILADVFVNGSTVKP